MIPDCHKSPPNEKQDQFMINIPWLILTLCTCPHNMKLFSLIKAYPK